MSDRIDNDATFEPRPDMVGRLPIELQMAGALVFFMGEVRIIWTNVPEEGHHASISCADRDPTWGEIATVRYRLLAGVPCMVMHLPPLSDYVNSHPHTFHLHQFPVPQASRIILAA